LNSGYYYTDGIPTGNPHVLNTRPPNPSEGVFMPVIILRQRKGLTRDQKRRIVKEFTETMVNVAGVKKELVTIMIEEK
jgi:4-oxalocrotonate tautomerase